MKLLKFEDIEKYFINMLKYFFVNLIKIYKIIISPILIPSCRFYPSCSEYSITAFNKHGIFKGFFLTIKRILRCNPFGGSGYDPVP